MKMTKTDFKGLIKECIRELIKEGAFNEVANVVLENAGAGPKTSIRVAASDMVSKSNKNPVDVARARAAAARMAGYDDFMPEGDSTSYGSQAVPNVNHELKKLIEATSTQMSKGDNKMANAYAAILADTAINTLPQQMAQDPSRNGGYSAFAAAGMQGAQEKVAPQDLEAIAPSGDVSHWAKLAFGKINK